MNITADQIHTINLSVAQSNKLPVKLPVYTGLNFIRKPEQTKSTACRSKDVTRHIKWSVFQTRITVFNPPARKLYFLVLHLFIFGKFSKKKQRFTGVNCDYKYVGLDFLLYKR